MTDIFEKQISEVKLPDYIGELAKAYQKPAPLPKAEFTEMSAVRAAQQAIKEYKPPKASAIAPAILAATAPAFIKPAGYDELPFEQQSALYKTYLDGQIAAFKAANPKGDELALEDALKTKNPPPIDPTGGKGDFARGLSQYVPQTKGMLQGAAGLLLKKVGADETGDAFLQDAQKSYTESGNLSKKNDAFTEALKKDGSLIDWAQYTVGNLAGSVLESVAVAGAGALVGGAAGGGVASVPTAIGGGAIGLVGKTLVKKVVKEAIEAELETIVKDQMRKGLVETAARTFAEKAVQKKLAQAAGKAAGSTTALLAAAGTRGTGEIVQQAQQAGLDPDEISAFDLATGVGVYALAETLSDKLLLGAFGKATTRGVTARTAIGGVTTGLAEGGTEVLQDAAVGLAAGTGLQSPEQALNAFMAGAVGGGAVGAGGAAFTSTAPKARTTPSPTAQLTTEQDTPAASIAGTSVEIGGSTLNIDANGIPSYADGQTPNPTADVYIAAAQANQARTNDVRARRARTPVTEPTGMLPGTTTTVGGASLIVGADGSWGYNQGAAPNAIADAEIAMRNGAVSVAPAVVGAEPTVTAPAPSNSAAVQARSADVQLLDNNLRTLQVPERLANPATRFLALQELNNTLLRMPVAQRQELSSLASTSAGDLTPADSPLIFAVRNLGLALPISLNGNAAWAQNVQNSANIENILSRMATTPEDVGTVNAGVASALYEMFGESGVAAPSVTYQENPSARNELGLYDSVPHRITFNRTSTANTVLHEVIHALTVRGYNRIRTGGDQASQDINTLINELHAQLQSGAPSVTYGNDNPYDMIAELVRPEFLALANNKPLGPLSASAQRGLAAIQSSPNRTVLQVIADFIAYVLNQISPGTTVDSNSVLFVLQQVAADLTVRTAPATTAPTVAAPAPTAPRSVSLSQARAIRDDTGGDMAQMLAQGVALQQMREVGIRLSRLLPYLAGRIGRADATRQLLDAGYPLQDFTDAGVSLSVLLNAGVTAAEMNSAGISNARLLTVGFTQDEIDAGGIVDRQTIVDAARQVQSLLATSNVITDRQSDAFLNTVAQFRSSLPEADLTAWRRYDDGISTLRELVNHFAPPAAAAAASTYTPRGVGSQPLTETDEQYLLALAARLRTQVGVLSATEIDTQMDTAISQYDDSLDNQDAEALLDYANRRSSIIPFAAPTPIAPATAAPTINMQARLPNDLRSARYNVGRASVTFASDIDRAIIYATGTSNRKDDYKAWLLALGIPQNVIRILGPTLRTAVNRTISEARRGRTEMTVRMQIPAILTPEMLGFRAAPVAAAPAATGPSAPNDLPQFVRWGGATLTFSSDVDRAFAVIAQGGTAYDSRYREWLNSFGITDDYINRYTDTLRDRLNTFIAGRTGNITVDRTLMTRTERTVNEAARAERTEAAAPVRPIPIPFTEKVYNAFKRFASMRSMVGRMRGLKAQGALGSLVPATANMEQKKAHFWEAIGEGMRQIIANPRYANTFRYNPRTQVIEVKLSSSTWGQVPVGFTSYGKPKTTTSIFREVEGFGDTGSAGTIFYDMFNGAIVSSRLEAYNGGLEPENQYRLPINRLRAMLKWGAITGDFDSAVSGLFSDLNSNANTPAAKFTRQLSIVADNAMRYAQPGLRGGAFLYDADTNEITSGTGSFALAELTPLSRSPLPPATRANNYANHTERAQASASTPDSIALTALANSIQATTDYAAAQDILDAAFGGEDGNTLMTTVFSLPEDDSIADIVFSLPEQELQAANNIVPDVLPNTRTSYPELQTSIASGAQAPAVSPTSEIRQAAHAGNWRGVLHGMAGVGKWLNQKLHDHLLPMADWIEALPIPDGLRASITAAMYRAPGTRDFLLNDAMENYGGKELSIRLAAFATKHNITVETAIRDAGYWATATRASTGNAILIDGDAKALEKAQRALEANTDPEATRALQREVTLAQRQLLARVTAVNNPQTKVKFHTGGGVAGFNNAQARLLLSTLEARYPRTEMQEIASTLQSLNAWRLAVDIETGKTSVDTAVKFLRRPDLRTGLDDLHRLARMTDATNAEMTAALELKRKEVIEAVKSDYVPLTGDPNQAQTDNIFYSGGRQPNTARDYRMGGRTTSIPDDAVSATLAAVIKSASYGGWRDFQDGVAEAYAAMTPAQREQAGIFRTVVGDKGAVPADSIVLRRGGSMTAYTLADRKLLESVRGSNFEDNGNIFLAGMGKFTRLYSYVATQIAPWFAPKNFIRDFWDRSELVRTRKYFDTNGIEVDSTKVARTMLGYMASPAKLATLMRATQQHAFAVDGSKSYEGRHLAELLRLGGGSIFGDRFTANRADLVNSILEEKNGSQQVKKLLAFVAKYNKMFDLGPALAAYIALREAGVPAERAAGGALDLMNFRKRGENSAILSAFYAFAQPAITSGVNTFSSLGTRRGQVRLIGYTAVLMGLQAFLRGLADEDEGGNRLDQQSDFLQNTHILVPFGNGIIKVPLAFGLVRIANSMARQAIGVGTGNLTLKEAGGDLVSGGIVPVISPIEDINIPWDTHPVQAFGLTFSPTWVKPLMAVGFNQTPWGTAITNDKYEDTAQYKSEQFGKGVSPMYKEIAVFIRENIGTDLSPEDVKYIIKGYPLGPGTMLVNGFIENPYKESKGRATENPAVQQVYAGYSEAAIYFQFKEALAKTDRILKEVNVGNTSFTAKEQAMLDWRRRWDKTEDLLNAAKAKITRDKTLSEEGKKVRKDAIQRQREQATTLALYQYRVAIGLPAKRTEAWMPK